MSTETGQRAKIALLRDVPPVAHDPTTTLLAVWRTQHPQGLMAD
ncbi:hypothetical protein [Spirosoma sp.]|nr:hypothetical protein [Spirosoma sp.]